MKPKRVLTTGQVAKTLSVSTRMVQKWFDEGLLKGYKLPASHDRRIRLEELKEFMIKYDMPVELLDDLPENSK
jgi:excisionase family DNA binding protein